MSPDAKISRMAAKPIIARVLSLAQPTRPHEPRAHPETMKIRHSGASRNPDTAPGLDPGFRRGDGRYFRSGVGRPQGKARRPGAGRLVAARPAGLVLVPLVFAALLVAAPAGAHQRSLSVSTWRIDGREARVSLRVSELDLTRIPPPLEGEKAIGRWLVSRLELVAAAASCAVTSPPVASRPEPGWVLFRWRVGCPPEGALRLRSRLFAETSARHLHFARVERDGRTAERVLSGGESDWPFETGGDGESGTGFAGYVVLGVEHILGGADHLAFLLALLLFASSLGVLARVVTGFTIGHSLTLGLAATGVVAPAIEPIEALIGLSIALVAVENLWLLGSRPAAVPAAVAALLAGLAAAALGGRGGVPPMTLAGFALFVPCYFALLGRSGRPGTVRGAVAVLFGLLHGFGFASVLVEAGLPPGRLVQALLGFNLGVEAGQLAVVALLWVALRRANAAWRVRLAEIGSASVLAAGTFWFTVRAFG